MLSETIGNAFDGEYDDPSEGPIDEPTEAERRDAAIRYARAQQMVREDMARTEAAYSDHAAEIIARFAGEGVVA